MFKKAFLTLALVTVLAAPAVSQATVQDDLIAQINSLLGIVASLQQQLSAVHTGSSATVVSDFNSCVSAGNPVMESYPRQCAHNGQVYVENVQITGVHPTTCPLFSRNLYLGMRGNDVSALQEFLRSAGTYSYPSITGYFGPATQSAVQLWQAQHGVVAQGTPATTGYGVVGPSTRNTIVQSCGQTAQPQQPQQPTICTLQYDPVCGMSPTGEQKTYGNTCQLNAAGADQLYAGECSQGRNVTAPNTCRVWYDGCNTCSRSYEGGPLACTLRACIWQDTPRCESYFSGGGAPIITGFNGPTALSVSQVGTWTINASDPENGSLSYRVDWGESVYVNSYDALSALANSGFVQRTTFTHAYSASGIYTVTITVRDSQGLEATTSSTVVVGGGTTLGGTFTATPTSGSAPLTVLFTAPSGSSCVDGNDYKIEYGDGTSAMTPSCGQGTASMSHTYTTNGVYTATLYAIPSGFGTGDRTPRVVDTKRIVVSGTTVGCYSSGQYFSEGTTKGCIQDTVGGLNRCIADAYFVCRSGEWQIEGGYPGSNTNSISITAPNSGTYTFGDVVRVTWNTGLSDSYGMYLVLEDINGNAMQSKKVIPSDGVATFDTDYFCNNFFSDAIDAQCSGFKSNIAVKGQTQYRIRAAVYSPENACFGFCAPGSATNVKTIATAVSNIFFVRD